MAIKEDIKAASARIISERKAAIAAEKKRIQAVRDDVHLYVVAHDDDGSETVLFTVATPDEAGDPSSRRSFLTANALAGVVAAGLNVYTARVASNKAKWVLGAKVGAYVKTFPDSDTKNNIGSLPTHDALIDSLP